MVLCWPRTAPYRALGVHGPLVFPVRPCCVPARRARSGHAGHGPLIALERVERLGWPTFGELVREDRVDRSALGLGHKELELVEFVRHEAAQEVDELLASSVDRGPVGKALGSMCAQSLAALTRRGLPARPSQVELVEDEDP